MPEGIIPFNEKHQQGFGLCAYEICSAVHPDYLIMSLYNGEYTQQFLDEMNNLTKYRLHVEIDDFMYQIMCLCPLATKRSIWCFRIQKIKRMVICFLILMI